VISLRIGIISGCNQEESWGVVWWQKILEIYIVGLEFESGCVFLVRTWNNHGFTRSPKPIKYAFWGMGFPWIQKKKIKKKAHDWWQRLGVVCEELIYSLVALIFPWPSLQHSYDLELTDYLCHPLIYRRTIGWLREWGLSLKGFLHN